MSNTGFFNLWFPRYDKRRGEVSQTVKMIFFFYHVKLGGKKILLWLKLVYENCTTEFHTTFWSKWAKFSKVEKFTFFIHKYLPPSLPLQWVLIYYPPERKPPVAPWNLSRKSITTALMRPDYSFFPCLLLFSPLFSANILTRDSIHTKKSYLFLPFIKHWWLEFPLLWLSW